MSVAMPAATHHSVCAFVHQVGAKLKVYDSRMEKFCHLQLPLLPEDWRQWFLVWWDEVHRVLLLITGVRRCPMLTVFSQCL